MENATKALIIAGAILISIVLIGIGVMVVGGAQGAIDESILQMSQQQKDMFNKRYTAYTSGTQVGSNIKTLISNVNTNNMDAAANQIEGRTIKVILDGEEGTESTELTALSAKVNTGARYTVTLGYNTQTVLVDTITITKVVAGGTTTK